MYFLLKYVVLPVLFTLTQVVLLLITSTFTRVQIQSNLGTTEENFDVSKKILRREVSSKVSTNDEEPLLETSKFSLYFSGSCIPIIYWHKPFNIAIKPVIH